MEMDIRRRTQRPFDLVARSPEFFHSEIVAQGNRAGPRLRICQPSLEIWFPGLCNPFWDAISRRLQSCCSAIVDRGCSQITVATDIKMEVTGLGHVLVNTGDLVIVLVFNDE